MKTLNILLLAAALQLTNQANAQMALSGHPSQLMDKELSGANKVAEALQFERICKAIDRQLERKVIFPYATHEDLFGTMEVTYKVNAAGHLEVQRWSATNQQLAMHVLGRIAHVEIAPPNSVIPERTVHFTFRPQ